MRYSLSCSDDGKEIEPPPAMFPHERIERQDATLAFVIGAQCQYNIFQCCLNSERPDDARLCTKLRFCHNLLVVNHDAAVVADGRSLLIKVLWVEAYLVVPVNGKRVKRKFLEELHVFQFLHDSFCPLNDGGKVYHLFDAIAEHCLNAVAINVSCLGDC